MTKPRFITFDVYGTLVRWDETVRSTLSELLTANSEDAPDVEPAANAFEAESRRLQTVGAFRSYRSILGDSLVPAFATAGRQPTREDTRRFLEALASIPPFPEVPPVLAALARDHRLVPISNTDDDLLAGTLAGLGDVFATTVTAEQALAYKPNPGLFRFALDKLGIDRRDVIHVAQGTFSDLAVCSALGIRVVWVNRQKLTEQRGLQPDATIDDLTSLEATISALEG